MVQDQCQCKQWVIDNGAGLTLMARSKSFEDSPGMTEVTITRAIMAEKATVRKDRLYVKIEIDRLRQGCNQLGILF